MECSGDQGILALVYFWILISFICDFCAAVLAFITRATKSNDAVMEVPTISSSKRSIAGDIIARLYHGLYGEDLSATITENLAHSPSIIYATHGYFK